MKKSLSLTLYIVGLVLVVAAIKLPFLYGSSAAPLATVFYIVGGIVLAVAWVSTLIRLTRLRLWNWFLFVLLLSVIALPVYIFRGPTPEKLAEAAAQEA